MNHHDKQPRGLYSIAATNLAERFGYYAMRSILILYMIKVMLLSKDQAYAIFATFTALLYLAPLIGGHLADRYFGTKFSVLLGSALLSMGYFLLAIPGSSVFYSALATIVIGNGFFMPNISSALGKIYQENDPRRDSGFSILYSAVNLGAFVPPIICTGVILKFGWHAGFLMAGFATSISTCLAYLTKESSQSNSKLTLIILSGCLVMSVFLVSQLVQHADLANPLLFSFGIALTLLILKKSFNFETYIRNRLIACIVLTAFSILFSVLCEQAAMSLTVFTEYNVNRQLYHWIIPTTSFLALNPLFIILSGPVIAKLWFYLDKKNCRPSLPTKFAFGTILVGLAFIIFPVAIRMQLGSGIIHFSWIVLSYFLQSLGELLVYPVGLAMMTSLAPKQMVGLMIGLWYFATAIANALAGYAAMSTAVASNANTSLQASVAYAHVFGTWGLMTIIAGIILLIFSSFIQRLIVTEKDSTLDTDFVENNAHPPEFFTK